MDENTLKKYRIGCGKIRTAIAHIEDISSLLHEVGLDRLSARINGIYNILCDGLEAIKESHDEDFNQQVKRTQEASANVLKACLAGTKLGREENVDR